MFIEEQIQKLQRRVKSIEQNPRPEFMHSNKLRYVIELEQYESTLEAWMEGKPFAILAGAEQLTLPLGFHHQGYFEWGDRVTDPRKYENMAVRKFGFPEHTCDRTLAALGLLLNGEVPMPRLMLSRRMSCDPERWSFMAGAKYAGVLFFDMDRRLRCDEQDISYVAEQLAEMIEFATASIPGIRFDNVRLLEVLEMDDRAVGYMRETYELRKRVPCPISPQDSFRIMRVPSRYQNPAKVLEYCRVFRDELFDRAEKSVGGVREEKLRVAWLATGPYGRTTFDLLAEKGVSLPWFQFGFAPFNYGLIHDGYGDDTVYGRKLTPLEEVARSWNYNSWAGTAANWIDPLIQACRDLKIDAVVDFLQPGCITTKNLKWITAMRLQQELGIPTLDLEGRELFSTEADQIKMNRRLAEFLDMCIEAKQHGGPNPQKDNS